MHRREAELAEPGALERLTQVEPTLADAIDRYISTSRKDLGKTKAQVLKAIRAHPMADLGCSKVNSTELVQWVVELNKARTPQTAGNYLAHLRAVFTVAKPAFGYPLDMTAINDATVVAKRLGLTSRSRERTRRPELAELDKLMEHYEDREARSETPLPMRRIIVFAIFSTRRLSEITRIRWADLDRDHSRALVTDMKNPGEKLGNNVWVDLVPEAMAVIDTMPKGSEFIFPFNPDTISMSFTRACSLLGIEDLHFHDLRHDGVSRLFEMGWTLPHVAAVSGHRSWASLKRYTHVRTKADKYAGWRWSEMAL